MTYLEPSATFCLLCEMQYLLKNQPRCFVYTLLSGLQLYVNFVSSWIYFVSEDKVDTINPLTSEVTIHILCELNCLKYFK